MFNLMYICQQYMSSMYTYARSCHKCIHMLCHGIHVYLCYIMSYMYTYAVMSYIYTHAISCPTCIHMLLYHTCIYNYAVMKYMYT